MSSSEISKESRNATVLIKEPHNMTQYEYATENQNVHIESITPDDWFDECSAENQFWILNKPLTR
jgi:hypothetical protein